MSIEGGVGGLSIKFPIIVKVFLAVIGVLIALVFSGDITEDKKLNLSSALLIKVSFGMSASLTGAPFLIERQGWQLWSLSAQGFVFLMSAVFGLLIIGIFYRAVEMYQGKSISEIIKEIKSVIKAILS